jgi:hypothetical protein
MDWLFAIEAPTLPVLLLTPILLFICVRAHKADANKEHHRERQTHG